MGRKAWQGPRCHDEPLCDWLDKSGWHSRAGLAPAITGLASSWVGATGVAMARVPRTMSRDKPAATFETPMINRYSYKSSLNLVCGTMELSRLRKGINHQWLPLKDILRGQGYLGGGQAALPCRTQLAVITLSHLLCRQHIHRGSLRCVWRGSCSAPSHTQEEATRLFVGCL
jgi:hypothetical protein